jgi:hypothetical protein
MKTSWRITPAPHIAAEVRQLALFEGRSDSAMLERLVGPHTFRNLAHA